MKMYGVISEVPGISGSRYVLDTFTNEKDAISEASYWNFRTGDNRLIYPLSDIDCVVYVEMITLKNKRSYKMKRVSDLLNMVDEMLDEGKEIKIGVFTYAPSQVLKEVDPIAYRETVLEIADAENIDIDELIQDADF